MATEQSRLLSIAFIFLKCCHIEILIFVRYSYNPNYFSSMFDPVDVDEFYRKKDAEAKESWRTKEGFIYPGMNSSMQDNYHSLKPAESRIADLKLSFRDNVLHRNVMEPILERDNFKYEHWALHTTSRK